MFTSKVSVANIWLYFVLRHLIGESALLNLRAYPSYFISNLKILLNLHAFTSLHRSLISLQGDYFWLDIIPLSFSDHSWLHEVLKNNDFFVPSLITRLWLTKWCSFVTTPPPPILKSIIIVFFFNKGNI